ncbi:hypothetical protein M5E88_10835 [Akkermansia muciniphila]|nr:hypothetical protein M5E88_10835 [Akkermansia muciniphila]
MIQFNTPEWFFLLPLLLATGWKYRRLRLASPCASSCRPACCWPWLSLPLTGAAKTWTCGCWWTNQIPRREFRQPGQRKSRLFWNGTNMPGTASDWWISRNPPCSGTRRPRLCRGTAGTDMEQALAYTMALMSPNRTNRILMLTDGWPTTPLDQAAEQLIQSRIPVDYRLSVTFREADIRIEQIRTPARIRPGEAFILEATLAGPPGPAITVPWQISKNGGSAAGNGYPAQRQSHGEAGGQALHPRLFRL